MESGQSGGVPTPELTTLSTTSSPGRRIELHPNLTSRAFDKGELCCRWNTALCSDTWPSASGDIARPLDEPLSSSPIILAIWTIVSVLGPVFFRSDCQGEV